MLRITKDQGLMFSFIDNHTVIISQDFSYLYFLRLDLFQKIYAHQFQLIYTTPSDVSLVLCSLVPCEERMPRVTVHFLMGPTPRTRVRLSQQLTRDSDFSTMPQCFRCFKKGHMSKSCYSKKCCSQRNGKHHLALCKSTGIDEHKSSGTDPTEEHTSKRNPEKEDSTIPEGSTLVGSTHTSQDTILLQSALVDIATGSRSCLAHLLFDSGSQHTFISQDLANKIGVQPFKKEELLMSMFGHDKRTKADFKTVRVCLMADGEGIIINALVPTVISPLISAHLQDDDLSFPYLQGLRLADLVRTRGPLEIIIIGNDYYGSVSNWRYNQGRWAHGYE